MVRRNRNLDDAALDEVESLLDESTRENIPPDADAAIHAWLNVFTRLLHLPEAKRSAIRSELHEHLRERTRDLMLANRSEPESLRIAIDELGETAQLARRFEAANRPHTRRWLMYASMLGLSAAILFTGAVVLTPDSQPQPMATAFQKQDPKATDAIRQLSQAEVDIPVDVSLLEVARVITQSAGADLVLSPAEFEAHGIDVNDHRPQLVPGRKPVPIALDLLVKEISRDGVPFAWQVRDRMIEIAAKEDLDARDVTLVSYNIADVIRSITTYGRVYESAVADVTSLLHELVEPDSWRENGGALAQLRVVGGRMFVQAPQRMHAQIEWILEQLRQDDIDPDVNQRKPAQPADPVNGVR